MAAATPVIQLDKTLRVVRIIWFVLVVEAVWLPIVGVLAGPEELVGEPAMLWALAAVSLVVLAVSVILPRRMLIQGLSQRSIEVVEQADPEVVPGFYRDKAPMRRVFADPRDAQSAIAPRYNVYIILTVSLRNAVALFGLVLLMMGFSLVEALPFSVVSFIAMVVAMPRRAQAVGLLEEAKNAKLDLEGGP